MNPIVVVAAYDFGTTYSGYAFSFYDKVMAIRYQQTWEGAPKELMSQKTATSLLLNPQGEFDKFGYEAETKYAELAAEVKHEGWRLFRQFKMLLHNNKVRFRTLTTRVTIIRDLNMQRDLYTETSISCHL